MRALITPRRAWFWAAAVVWLAGCSTLPRPPQAVTRYDLGAPAALAAPPAVALPAVALGPVQAPLLSDGSTLVHYRLAYADAQVLRAYTQARWSVPPAQMVQQRLREHLTQGGRVVLSAAPGEAPPSVQGRQVPVLRLALEEFSHVFTSAQDSVGWVRVRATLVDPAPQGDVLLAQRVLEVRQPASAPNAAAGVQALAQGVDVLGGALTQWLQTVSKR
ncbi:ABC-type transport auxiliary lipoprotein family protein [Comamonas aquatica]|uniref:ABC-type transport auxiliary lipoprotein family protein n=1 Tax=Comamonas aquatica TaxID=225991 RepID=UPI001B36ABFD|nr:ABC-type transport auxiliary lipoprotein family protein [Comamonas aquatica]QTX20765.1 membrane integrity-associated transporter subunit PqiC [Comamonas aquatica]